MIAIHDGQTNNPRRLEYSLKLKVHEENCKLYHQPQLKLNKTDCKVWPNHNDNVTFAGDIKHEFFNATTIHSTPYIKGYLV